MLLRRPPGREAYPGDIFYLHARLLERSGRRHQRLVRRIDHGPADSSRRKAATLRLHSDECHLDHGWSDLPGERVVLFRTATAINVGRSVSSRGRRSPDQSHEKGAGPLRINLAQYRSLEAFASVQSELDEDTAASS
jgi:F-type H+-transporting ATPase subunit alpha